MLLYLKIYTYIDFVGFSVNNKTIHFFSDVIKHKNKQKGDDQCYTATFWGFLSSLFFFFEGFVHVVLLISKVFFCTSMSKRKSDFFIIVIFYHLYMSTPWHEKPILLCIKFTKLGGDSFLHVTFCDVVLISSVRCPYTSIWKIQFQLKVVTSQVNTFNI